MTPEELVDVHNTPGSFQLFGTDVQGYKDWVQISSLVVLVTPDTTTLLNIPHTAAGGICLIAQPGVSDPRGVYWDSASTDTHDGTMVWKPSSLSALAAGRWLRWL